MPQTQSCMLKWGSQKPLTAALSLQHRVALTLEDSSRGVLRSGEPLDATAARLASLPGVEAVLLNCCAPEVGVPPWDRVPF